MTIYSQHPSRGKVQVLATFHGPDGVASETVTSVESGELAGPLVEALNRVSAAATTPVCLHDQRRDKLDRYPHSHLAALTDPEVREDLLKGAHSLWYVVATWSLHEALTELDDALKQVPAPVRISVLTELAVEARSLRVKVAEERGEEVDEGEGRDKDAPGGKIRRVWDSTSFMLDDQLRVLEVPQPFVFDEDLLGSHLDRTLEKLEAACADGEVERAADDLRLLLDVWVRSTEAQVEMRMEGLEVTFDPSYDSDLPDGKSEQFLLNLHAPQPGGKWGRDEWGISLDRWVTDALDEDGYPSETHSEEVLHCALGTRPVLSDLLVMLDQASNNLEDWANTPVGRQLEGTAFVVTRRTRS